MGSQPEFRILTGTTKEQMPVDDGLAFRTNNFILTCSFKLHESVHSVNLTPLTLFPPKPDRQTHQKQTTASVKVISVHIKV